MEAKHSIEAYLGFFYLIYYDSSKALGAPHEQEWKFHLFLVKTNLSNNLINMKVVFLFTLLVAALTVNAQNTEVPQNGFTISFSKDLLELSRGENGQIEIKIVKSRSYRKSKIKMGVPSVLPKGVTITFDPDNDNFESTKANILIQADATPGQYVLVLNATLNYKTKGTTLKLVIK